MDNTKFIKAIQGIYNNSYWNAISNTHLNDNQLDDVIMSLDILNSKKLGFNTISLLIDENYYEILFEITDNLTEDELSEQGFNSEFAKRLAPFVAKHILKRYFKVSGKDARLKRKDKNIIVLNFDFEDVTYFTATKDEEK